MSRMTLAPVKLPASFWDFIHLEDVTPCTHKRHALKWCPCTLLLFPWKNHKRERQNNPALLYCTASPFLSNIQQVSWGHEKKSKLPHCRSTYRQYEKQISSGNLCASNLASLAVCIWKSGYFHKRHNPEVNNSNFWKETDQTKNSQLAKRKRIISVFCWWITWNSVEQGCLPSFLTKLPDISLISEDEVKFWWRISAIHRWVVVG